MLVGKFCAGQSIFLFKNWELSLGRFRIGSINAEVLYGSYAEDGYDIDDKS